MRYGFVLDQNRCIGCHACTVACKEEHGVPVGVNRTWVKYVEKGTFPDTQRHFAVLRCNHCDDAPCITICPTGALFKRKNGIVDFDKDACIGCKACMQACPYDALYIDPQTQTAAKCNFCAHRVDKGLEPACVIVCPEQAIITGDLDNPNSRIAQIISRESVSVRKPEQGTKPKTFYLGADEAALTPTMSEVGQHQMWATPNAKEVDFAKTLSFAAQSAPGVAKAVYDPPHERAPWGWKVSAYLWTKSIAAGALGVAAAAVGCGVQPSRLLGPVAAGIALLFTALTCLLLVLDLKRPERFYLILLRPNWRSWLVWGTLALMAFSGIAVAWLVASLSGADHVLRWLAWPAVALSALAAGYSAFLFGQCEGRDFWQSPLLLVQLLVAAALAGAATLILVQGVEGSQHGPRFLELTLGVSLVLHLVVLAGELLPRHASEDAARAAGMIVKGKFAGRFRVMVLNMSLGAWIAFQGGTGMFAACMMMLAMLWVYEHLWIKAGQSVPLS